MSLAVDGRGVAFGGGNQFASSNAIQLESSAQLGTKTQELLVTTSVVSIRGVGRLSKVEQVF